MSVADYVVLASYVTLLLEIGLFPIASEASVVQLVGRRTESRAPAMMAARAAPLPTRLLRYLLLKVCDFDLQGGHLLGV